MRNIVNLQVRLESEEQKVALKKAAEVFWRKVNMPGNVTVKKFMEVLMRSDPADIAEVAIRRYQKEINMRNPVDVTFPKH